MLLRASRCSPHQLSSDHDPLFEFHRWKANLRILDVTEVKTVPHDKRASESIGDRF